VIISELEIQYEARKIVAASYGRGIWESPLYEDTDIEGLGISGDGFTPFFKVYPVPAENELYLEIANATEGQIVVDVYDLQGRLVLQDSFESAVAIKGKLNVNTLKPATYFIRARNGNTIYGATFQIVR
jgi:hypothetical protein